jgi:hypothetical protein
MPSSILGLSEASAWDYENGFYWFSHPTRIYKLLAHYDLYRQIIGLPGDIFELGVYKAASLIRLASFRALLENNYSRKIIGFDAFGAFPTENLKLRSDHEFVRRFEAEVGDGIGIEHARAIFARKGFDNVFLYEGNIFKTLPSYLEENSAARIAFLHLDMDVKEPTAFALELLYSRVVRGGLIVFDDYPTVAGETEAVDEFIAAKNLRLEKLSHYSIPAYVKKQ